MKLSVALATYNEEENLDTCLASVASWVDEIIIVDGGSTDKTVKIANSYKAKVISADNPAIFHFNKQKAIEACRGDWILQLDADEIITQELQEEIVRVISGEREEGGDAGYFIARKNFFLGKWLKKGGLYPDHVIRLFMNKKGRFPCKSVHEQIEISGKVGYLKNPMIHNTAPTLHFYWLKARRYVALQASDYRHRKVPKNAAAFLKYIFFLPARTFLERIFRHKSILDGWRGVLFAYFSAIQIPMAYFRYLMSAS